jgi:hypothetical protein
MRSGSWLADHISSFGPLGPNVNSNSFGAAFCFDRDLNYIIKYSAGLGSVDFYFNGMNFYCMFLLKNIFLFRFVLISITCHFVTLSSWSKGSVSIC